MMEACEDKLSDLNPNIADDASLDLASADQRAALMGKFLEEGRMR